MSVESGRRLIEFDEAQKFRNDKFCEFLLSLLAKKALMENSRIIYYITWHGPSEAIQLQVLGGLLLASK